MWFEALREAVEGLRGLLESGELAPPEGLERDALLDWMGRSLTQELHGVWGAWVSGGGWIEDRRIWVAPGEPNEPEACRSGPLRGIYQLLPRARIDPDTGEVSAGAGPPRAVAPAVAREALASVAAKVAAPAPAPEPPRWAAREDAAARRARAARARDRPLDEDDPWGDDQFLDPGSGSDDEFLPSDAEGDEPPGTQTQALAGGGGGRGTGDGGDDSDGDDDDRGEGAEEGTGGRRGGGAGEGAPAAGAPAAGEGRLAERAAAYVGKRMPVGPLLAAILREQEAAGVQEYYTPEHLRRLLQWESDAPFRRRPRHALCKDAHGKDCALGCSSCHWCRQKLAGPGDKTWCPCGKGKFCASCLENRFGENFDVTME